MKILNKYNNRGINIITVPRTGSTYLINILKSVFKVQPIFISEVRHRQNTIREMFDFFKIQEENILNPVNTNYISKTYTQHIQRDGIINNSYNIFLFRKNLFHNILSIAYSKKIRMWRFIQLKYKKIYITTSEFNDMISKIIKRLSDLLQNEHSIQYDMILSFEDLTFDATIDLNNLGMKQLREIKLDEKFPPLKERVLNYDELLEYYKTLDIKIPNTVIKDGKIESINIQNQKEN